MQRARALDSSRQSVPDRGADTSAPRSTPLTLVAGAVAGDDLESVAASVADALGCPVAIAIPALGRRSCHRRVARAERSAIAAHGRGVADEADRSGNRSIAMRCPVRIGEQVVGIVAAGAGGSLGRTGARMAGGGRGGGVGHRAHQGRTRARGGRGARRRAGGGTPGRPPGAAGPGAAARRRPLGRAVSRSAPSAATAHDGGRPPTAHRRRWWPSSRPGTPGGGVPSAAEDEARRSRRHAARRRA